VANDLEILYEDNHCLVVNKPAGLLVQGDQTGDTTLADRAAAWVKVQYDKPGRVFLGVVHRLDRPVSGIVILARTSKATSRLAAAFRDGHIKKTYQAIVAIPPDRLEGRLQHFLLKDSASNTTRVVTPEVSGAKKAVLHYRVVKRVAAGALVEVHPETGRPHQIRVQLAAIAQCIVGDVRYGSEKRLGSMIALHASAIAFPHPVSKEMIEVECELPENWSELLKKKSVR